MVRRMKTLKQIVKENFKFKINRNNTIYAYHPMTFDELRQIIEQRYEEQGPGTEQEPINFNDIDVSKITTFHNGGLGGIGIFQNTKFEYIDISDWDVSNIIQMLCMFKNCKNLESIGDLSKWDVSNVENMSCVFWDCISLKSIGDISNWNVSNTKYTTNMFKGCENLESIGDLSNWNVSQIIDIYGMFSQCNILQSIGDLSEWDVSNVKDMRWLFYSCKKLKSVGDLSNWNVSNTCNKTSIFNNSGITNIPKWYEE